MSLLTIWYLNVGWHGSTNDKRVYRNSRIIHKMDVHFRETEYINGDSEYSPMDFMISMYKKPTSAPLQPEKEDFTTKLIIPQVSYGHMIGILKERFPIFR